MKDRRSFYRYSPTIRFSKGETIILGGVIPNHIYCIKSGIVENFNYIISGNQQSMSFDVIGDIFPKCCAFQKTTRTLFEYRAFTDCELYYFSINEFQSQIKNNIDFTIKMLDRSTSSLLASTLKVEALEKPQAIQKIVYLFRYFCVLYGSSRSNGIVRIDVPITQLWLAQLTGLTRATINAVLSKLKKEKLFTYCNKHYTVDTIKLNSIIDNDYEYKTSLNLLHKKTMK